MEDLKIESMEGAAAIEAPVKRSIWHKLFGTYPGDGEMQPKEGIAYSLCGFGQNLICTIIGSYLTVFMTDAIGYGALAVALLMLFARIYDALNDPIMGSIVDRTRTPWGKCRPYLKWMAIPVSVVTILCFLPWYPNNPGGFAAMSIMYIIWGMVYTVCDVPYWGLNSRMSNDTFRRGNLLTIARLLCTAGAGIVTIVVPQVTSAMTGDLQTEINAYQSIVSQIQFAVDSEGGAIIVPDLADVDGDENTTEDFYLNFDADRTGTFKNITANYGTLENFILTEFGENSAVYSAWLAAGETYAEYDSELLGGKAYTEWTGNDLQTILDGTLENKQTDLGYIYFIAAIICVAVGAPLFFVGFKGTKERASELDNENVPSLKHNLQLLFKNKPLMLIVISGILGAARMVFTYTGGLYFCKYVLDSVNFIGMHGEGLYTLVTIAIVPGGLIASLLVPYLTKKIGKKQSYIWTNIAGGLALLVAFIVGISIDRGDYTSTATLVIALLAIVISGIPSGLTNIVSYAMIGDTIEYLELKTGERAEGICFAMQTFINKIGMAVGAFIGVMGYYLAGVTANNPGALDASGKDVMWIMLMLVAALSFILSAIPIFFYKFNEKEQQEAVAEIKRRKEAQEAELAAAGADGATVEMSAESAESGFADDSDSKD
ncbi:MAG TPA: MFS transporter [Candidatus Limadaptatus stercorigallinarum]|uniref:MFS transporter n=1 Tax=Candidatus Limadaptatus stercorigallinarum TaxID=2840845 RepID=A0A9D1HT75_9FIRM|nr:MFS transporter [Candidatus Limadaptatus stercorigallinarum]